MIILASQSPRRKELLSKIITEFQIIPSHIDEDKYPIDQLSLVKAKDIAKDYPSSIVIGADTLVFLKDDILGKPKDAEDAKRMLMKLSNNVHEVKTIYSIVCLEKNIEITRVVKSKVYFNNLSSSLIDEYVKSGSPLDKAGAYGIQDNEKFNLIKKIEGSYYNIVGLPIDELKLDLEKLNIK